jgi:sterol desaturase/sphingolipid hydroxylase (fatty acid hydroxylase superfamily)
MDESAYGKTERGHFVPGKPITYAPAFNWPPQPFNALKWFFGFPGFLFPWLVIYAALAFVVWTWFTPPLEQMKNLELGWIAYILARNAIMLTLVSGGFHLWFYTFRKQGTNFKYNKQWPKEKSSTFLFGQQIYDNMFYSLVSGVPIWTAYEVLLLWSYANGWAPLWGTMITWESNPVWFIAMFLVVPFIHDVGFYCAHRLIHWPPLYKIAHHVHHRNVSPGPWSGFSMHPIEHFFYLAPIVSFFVLPGHPIHIINLASRLGVAPAQGHTGFDRIDINDKTTWNVSYYAHYLHHKYFEVNYSDGLVPMDRWFGTFHDGTPEAHKVMLERRRKMAEAGYSWGQKTGES